MYRPRTVPVSPGYRSAACSYATEGPNLQCACLVTVTPGNAKVGVAVTVGDSSMVGVNVIVGLEVSVGVASGVSVGSFVAVKAGAVEVDCGVDGAQAEANSKTKRMILYNFILSLLEKRA